MQFTILYFKNARSEGCLRSNQLDLWRDKRKHDSLAKRFGSKWKVKLLCPNSVKLLQCMSRSVLRRKSEHMHSQNLKQFRQCIRARTVKKNQVLALTKIETFVTARHDTSCPGNAGRHADRNWMSATVYHSTSCSRNLKSDCIFRIELQQGNRHLFTTQSSCQTLPRLVLKRFNTKSGQRIFAILKWNF